MNAIEFVLGIQKLKPLHVPSDMASVRHDLEIASYTHLEFHCPRCRLIRLHPIEWLPRI